MSRNGSGVYSPSATGYPAVASTTIESAKYNAVIADIATALTLSIAANGETTITANIPLAGYKLTGVGNATDDADALNRVTADARYAVLTGPTFTGQVIISAAVPYLLLSETGVTADNGKWAMLANGEEFSIRAYTDDLGTVSQPMLVTRTGTTVDSITFAGTTIAVTGALTVNSIDVTPTQGSFTMSLRETTDSGTVIATGTAYYQKIGKCVTLRIPYLSAVSTATAFYITGVPAGAQVGTLADSQMQMIAANAINGAAVGVGFVGVPDGASAFPVYAQGAWTSGSSAKGITHCCITYMVSD